MKMVMQMKMEFVKTAQELVQHVSVHSGSNTNLAVLVFEERGKPEYPEMNLSEQGENQQRPQPTYNARDPFLESPENLSASHL